MKKKRSSNWRFSIGRWWILVLTLLLVASCNLNAGPFSNDAMQELTESIYAPDFPKDMQWFNTQQPLSLRQLQGKMVLLDFWTYCCINCMHIIPDLKRLEQEYGQDLVIIGVHSAKFNTEKQGQQIREAVLRYGLKHPVVNDKDFKIWDAYDVHAWPTLILIDPKGKIVGEHSGEGAYEAVAPVLNKLIPKYKASGQLKEGALEFKTEQSQMPDSLLYYPGKLLVDQKADLLFISDTGHHRLVVASPSKSEILAMIGSGKPGHQDGNFAQASFQDPQGLAWDGHFLYIADTGNHLIRRVNWSQQQVETIAGTGKQAEFYQKGGQGIYAALNSPWDLCLLEHTLYIAMAGSHQLWSMNLKSSQVGLYAGSGREGLMDGILSQAAYAQPSGLCSDGKKLYSADAETSSIRATDLPPGNEVNTLIGEDLFVFGDVDGKPNKARLQHPLGLTLLGNQLLVADTYNHKVKILDLGTHELHTWLGQGKPGYQDGEKALLNEPGGLSLAGQRVYIADTNNHVVRFADYPSTQVYTLQFKNAEKYMAMPQTATNSGDTELLASQSLRPGKVKLQIRLDLPKGYHVNENAPNFLNIKAEGNLALADGKAAWKNFPAFLQEVELLAKPGLGNVIVEANIYYCQNGKEALCLIKRRLLQAPFKIEAQGPSEAEVKISVPAKP